MFRPRVIPCLLLKNKGLVKTVKFSNPTYLGDPINVVKIFNDKEVDELIFLDILATTENRQPSFELLSKIAGECFMPLGYGGGVRTLEDIQTLLSLGIEKVVINSAAFELPRLVEAAANRFGSQSIVVSIDVRRDWLGHYQVYTQGGHKPTGQTPVEYARTMEKLGSGEIFLNAIDRDGMMQGYDLDLIRMVTESVNVPVVACGGAGNVQHLAQAVKEGGASAAAAGSLFVFQGPHRAVLITYPTAIQLQAAFDK
jgi:cyclase